MNREAYQRQAALTVIQDRRSFVCRWNDEDGMVEVLGLDGTWYFRDEEEIQEIAKWRYASDDRFVTKEGPAEVTP